MPTTKKHPKASCIFICFHQTFLPEHFVFCAHNSCPSPVAFRSLRAGFRVSTPPITDRRAATPPAKLFSWAEQQRMKASTPGRLTVLVPRPSLDQAAGHTCPSPCSYHFRPLHAPRPPQSSLVSLSSNQNHHPIPYPFLWQCFHHLRLHSASGCMTAPCIRHSSSCPCQNPPDTCGRDSLGARLVYNYGTNVVRHMSAKVSESETKQGI